MEALGESEAFLEFQERLSKVAAVDRPAFSFNALAGSPGGAQLFSPQSFPY
jgi:hypothetical protein